MLNFILEIIIGILRIVLPAIFAEREDTLDNADPQTELKNKLRDKIKRAGWCIVICCCLLSAGCFTKIVYVPQGTPVMLRQDIKAVKVWILDNNKKQIPATMDLKNGWYCVEMNDKEK